MKALWHSSAFRRTALLLFAVLLLGIFVVGQVAQPAQAQGTNLALNKPVTCSPTPQFPCAEAVDGNMATRWGSVQGVDPQWIQVDLGATTSISQVVLYWEAAYARSYQIQVSASASGPWTNIYSTTTGDGGTDTLSVSGSGRYVRMNGTVRATGYGYSLWEFQVYSGGTPPPTTPPPTTPPATTPPPTTPPPTTPPPSGNLALGKPVTCSSVENAGLPCTAAVDGNAGTRWASAYSDPQWIYVDLGATYPINRVVLLWEAAYGRSYQIQVSANASTWTNIYSTTTGDGGTDDLAVSGSGRYVRMNGTVRATGWGYSLWELQVYSGGTPPPTTPPPTTPPVTPTNTPTATRTPTATATTTTPTSCAGAANVALNRPATASSVENAGVTANLAVDGITTTRWASAFSDPQWIQLDLGGTWNICRVVLSWEAAYATAYQVQVSSNATTWTTIYSTTTGNGATDDLTVSGSGRYIRMNGTARATGYGYSLWEFQVYGTGGPTPTYTPTPPGGTDFWGDTSNIPPAQNVMTIKFLNRTNGQYPDSQVYWSFNSGSQSIVHTIAEQSTFDMPANSAGRMYFSLGAPANPANPDAYWDFIEFTIGPTVFNGNTTRVDAFGLKLAMRLHCDDGYDVSVGENLATFLETREATFQRFRDAVPAEFDHLADLHDPYRIVEPGAGEFKPGGLYATYYDSYINQMWTNNGLTVPRPGPNAEGLGAYPDLSAAIFRHVGAQAGTFFTDGRLQSQALWATPSTFYTAAPANYYAKFMHDIAIDGLAYGFPYDDVGGYSSFISHGDPTWLIVAIGW